jgi:rod shape-determining protein MreD
VTTLGAILFVACCVGLQALFGGLFPGAGRYVDFLVAPVIWFAIRRSQRAAMLTGSLAGLAQDAWFRSMVFGMGAFEKTFLGWLLGALATRFDMQSSGSLFLVGILFTLAQNLLGEGLGLLLLPDQVALAPDFTGVGIQAVVNGLIVVVSFRIVNRMVGDKPSWN